MADSLAAIEEIYSVGGRPCEGFWRKELSLVCAGLLDLDRAWVDLGPSVVAHAADLPGNFGIWADP